MPVSTGSFGFWGRICMVDLTSGQVDYEDLEIDLYLRFLGGIGLGAKVLWDRMRPGIDPLGPGNVLGFTTGLLTDTGSLFSGRFTVVGKSPASGGWGDSNCGGYFAPVLKRCGVDGLFFRGVSPSPVYLYIDDQVARLNDASDLWGLDTIETEQELRRRHTKASRVACIGPAGERRSFMAGICTDEGRIAARGGLGAVMGAKRLKAVVAAGKKRVPLGDKPRITNLSDSFLRRIRDWKSAPRMFNDRTMALYGWIAGKRLFNRQIPIAWRLLLRGYGTPSLVAMSAESGDSPMKNWTGAVDPDFPFQRYKKIGMDVIGEREVRKYGCHSCPVRCGAHVDQRTGPHASEKMHRPEYETICAFGPMLLNDDLESIFRLNDLVNRAGIDSISCGATVAFAMECFVNGILTPKDTGGLDLLWGNTRAIEELTRMIVARDGLGDVLADGVKRAADRIGQGSEAFAVHCGGVEAPMHDPRFDKGFIYSYGCDPTPGRHTITGKQFMDLQQLRSKFRTVIRERACDRGQYGKEASEMAIGAFYKMVVDCAGVCLFGTQVGGKLPLFAWMNAATGWGFTDEEYLIAGERVYQLRHAFNMREQLNPRKNFRPHNRILGDPPLTSGPLKGITLDFDAMSDAYFRVMGWDTETGVPDQERLRLLGLKELIQTSTGA